MKPAGASMAVVFLLCLATFAVAQQPGDLQGTVTLRSGEALTGKIQLAELGVVEGAGIGNSLPGHGAITVKVGEKTERIAGDEIATVEVEWVNTGSDAEPHWEIKKLTVVKKDGTKVTGTPDWLLHATNVWVITPSGETKRVQVFPFGNEPFNAGNLIAKITLGAAAAQPATAQPPAAKPQPEKPAAPKPAAQPPTEKPAEKPAPATAAAPKPTPTKPAAQPAGAPKPAAPAAGAAKPQQPPAAPSVVVPKAAVAAAGPVVAKDAMILLVRCPKCGQLLKIIISADVIRVEHVSEGK